MIKNVEIIVSRYNEDLKWILEYPFNEFQYIVYNKGINDNFEKTNVKQIINLPNVGKCDHTYLFHIINNFNNLSNINVFFPGSINIPSKKEKAINILNRIKNNNYTKAVFVGSYNKNILNEFKNFQLDDWTTTELQNLQINHESKLKLSILRPYYKWYLYHFGNLKITYNTYNSIFSIHKNDIIQHDISRYQKLIYGLSLHSNPEVGHYIERSWGAIFYPFKNTNIVIN